MEPRLRVAEEWCTELGRVVIATGDRGVDMVRSSCPHLQYWLLLEGQWTERMEGSTRKLSASEAVVYAPGQPSRRVAETPFTGLSVQVFSNLSNDAGCELSRSEVRTVWQFARLAIAGELDSWLLDETLLTLLQPRTLMSLKSQTRLHDMPAWLKCAYERLRDCKFEYPTLTELALQVGISPNHLSSEFASHFGISISTLVRRLKFRRAVSQSEQAESVAEPLWVTGGFYDAAHFNRVCKQEFGLTPTELGQVMTNRKSIQR